MLNKIVITFAQLKALQDYYEMYGVDAMEFELEKLSEILENFAPNRKELKIRPINEPMKLKITKVDKFENEGENTNE